MWALAVRPRWIAALILALAVAAGFALLSQWQLARSVSTGAVVERPTETTLPLGEVATPQHPVSTASDGQRVEVRGSFALNDFVVLSKRVNAGAEGFWVVGHLVTENGAGVAVGLGWAADEQTAASVAAGLSTSPIETFAVPTISGRFVADEAPQETDFEHGELSTLSTAALVNLWHEVDPAGVYNGYIVAGVPPEGLAAIDSPKPISQVEVNWLNIFYAAEWVIFAGFAVFLWWRLVRDAWEKEAAEKAEAETEAAEKEHSAASVD